MDGSTPPASFADLGMRPVEEADLPSFFVQQLDADANYMAAFTTKDPADRQAFTAHWARILANPGCLVRTLVVGGHVAGYVSSYYEAGKPEVTYWLGKEYWGQGLATRALARFLEQHQPTRGPQPADNDLRLHHPILAYWVRSSSNSTCPDLSSSLVVGENHTV